jgi:hypothetical protein
MKSKLLVSYFILQASFSYAGVVKIKTSGQPDVYVPTMDNDNSANLTVKKLKATSLNAPGVVPIGGMVAVMPSTHANAWQPPASGVIKDGFMLADGSAVPSCSDCILPTGTVLPNMVGSFPKGSSSTSGTATTAQKLVATNIPQINTSYTPTGTIDVTLSGSAPSLSSNTVASIYHNHLWLNTDGTTVINGLWSTADSSFIFYNLGGSVRSDNFLVRNPDVAQYTGWPTNTISSGYYGNGTVTVGISGGSYSIGTKTFTGSPSTITIGTAVGSQTTVPDPANVTVVWVIRVK